MSSSKSDSFLSDFGINSAKVMSKAILAASETNRKHNHNVPEFLILILIMFLSGGVVFFTSLKAFNILLNT